MGCRVGGFAAVGLAGGCFSWLDSRPVFGRERDTGGFEPGRCGCWKTEVESVAGDYGAYALEFGAGVSGLGLGGCVACF